MSFYRYQLPAFSDLYQINFATLTESQAAELNRRIFASYQSEKWIQEVVTEKANIELMFIDPYWDRLTQTNYYSFGVAVLNVTRLLRGFHPNVFPGGVDSPYRYAAEENFRSQLWTIIWSWLPTG